jgi:putative N6-adenine-specific DNA methylase
LKLQWALFSLEYAKPIENPSRHAPKTMVLQRRPGRRVGAAQSQHHMTAITVYLALFFCRLPNGGDAFLLRPVQVHDLPGSAGPSKNSINDGINIIRAKSSSSFLVSRLLRDPLFSTSSSSYNKNNAAVMHSYYLATTVPGLAGTLQTELIQLGGRRVESSGDSAVTFAVPDVTTIYTILLWSRTAHKIMELLIDSESAGDGGGATTTTNGGRRPPPRRRLMKTRDDVYKFVRNNIPVRDLLWDDGNGDDTSRGAGRWRTLSVSTTLNNPRFIPTDINHSHFTALNVKNALVDAARDEPVDIMIGGRTATTTTTTTGSRPDVDLDDPDVPLVVVLRGIPSEDRRGSDGAEIAIYRTLHTGSLHRRGYRSGSAVHKAGLKESLAAGLLLLAGWPTMTDNENDDNGKSHHYHLIDPMAGSGTLLIEAAMMSADYAPGLMRIRCEMPGAKIPPIVRWRQLGDDRQDERLWQTLLLDATARAKRGLARLNSGSTNVVFAGNDVHWGSVQLAEDAIRRAGFSNVIQMSGVDCEVWKGPVSSPHHDNDDDATSRCLVVCNPPWGVRLTEDMEESWDALRVFLRDVCPARYGSTTAWLLSGNADVTRRLKLRRSQSIPLQTGEQQLRWLEYNIAGGGGGARSSSTATSQSNQISSSSSSTESVREELGRWFRPTL